ncbi:Beta-glucosidase (SUN family) domain containing protein [Elaphomyces granulatus]
MKVSPLAVVLVAAGSFVAAQSHHHHQHRHLHVPRAPDASEPGETYYVYELNGESIPQDQACNGIQDGNLEYADGEAPPGACGPNTSVPQSTAEKAAAFYEAPPTTSASPTSTSTSSTSSSTSTTSSAPAPPAYTSAPSNQPSNSGGNGVNSEFPDGQLDCGTFPSDYGAIPLTYLGFNGWSGLQQVTMSGGHATNIVTGVSGDNCQDGYMCSYACPSGYQKSQWPESQGSSGQSVGGLACINGKLHLTNPGLSKSLCIPGVGGIKVQNTLQKIVSVCRTDYPGTESETIPLGVEPGQTDELTCPDGANYYKWEGKSTSAQYYINPEGYPPNEACQWCNSTNPIGNFAPMNLGLGQNGDIYMSLFPNSPTTNAQLDFNVRIEGNDLSGVCKYEGGVYYDSNGPNSHGCTVSSLLWTRKLIFIS